jgi:hypothetical protein
MANEVSPDLTKQIEDYLNKRSKGEQHTLAFFYREVFGRELKTNCGGCIEEGAEHLRRRITKKLPPMEKFKWVGNPKADVIIKHGGSTRIVNKDNVTDETAAIISGIGKYAHLVERIGPVDKGEEKTVVFKPVEKKSEPELNFQKLADITSTLTEVKTEDKKVRQKPGPKPKLK